MSVLLSSKSGFELPQAELSSLAEQLADYTERSSPSSGASQHGEALPSPHAGDYLPTSGSSYHHTQSPPASQSPHMARPASTGPASLEHQLQLHLQQQLHLHQQQQMQHQLQMQPGQPSPAPSPHSRSCSPPNAADRSSAQSTQPPPTQLVAMANELLDQLKCLSRCTSPPGSTGSGTSACNVATVSANGYQHSPVASPPTVPPTGVPSLPAVTSAAALRRVHTITRHTCTAHGGPLLNQLAALRRAEQLLDCTLVCEQSMLRAHKTLLGACSPYFRSMFASVGGCSNCAVFVRDVPALDLECILRILYGQMLGQIRIADRRLLSIWRSARVLKLRCVSEFLLRSRLLCAPDCSISSLSEDQLDTLQVQPNTDITPEPEDDEEDTILMAQLQKLDAGQEYDSASTNGMMNAIAALGHAIAAAPLPTKRKVDETPTSVASALDFSASKESKAEQQERKSQKSPPSSFSALSSNADQLLNNAALSQFALNGSNLSPAARALLLATSGSAFDSQSTNGTNPLEPNNALMAAAHQQLLGQLSGLANLSNSSLTSQANGQSNGQLQMPMKRGRGRPPRHNLTKDTEDDLKERAHSPLSSSRFAGLLEEANSASAQKKWRPNLETILALKSRKNKLNGAIPSLQTPSSTGVAVTVPTSASASAISVSALNSFERLSGLVGASPQVSVSTPSCNGMPVIDSLGRKPTLSEMRAGSKSLNDRSPGNQPDSKNVCPFCPQVYYSNQAMNDHINNVHTKNAVKYICEFCSKEFSWKISLTKHLKNSHNNGDVPAGGLNLTLAGAVPSSMSASNGLTPSQLQLSSQLASHQLLAGANAGDLFKNLMPTADTEMIMKFD